MKNTIQIIASLVVIAVGCWFAYIMNQESLRKKELDKKYSDNLELQKQINTLLKDKLEKGEIGLMTSDGNKFASNGHKKKKLVKLKKEQAS